jgi:hypothetical protein
LLSPLSLTLPAAAGLLHLLRLDVGGSAHSSGLVVSAADAVASLVQDSRAMQDMVRGVRSAGVLLAVVVCGWLVRWWWVAAASAAHHKPSQQCLCSPLLQPLAACHRCHPIKNACRCGKQVAWTAYCSCWGGVVARQQQQLAVSRRLRWVHCLPWSLAMTPANGLWWREGACTY